MGIWLKKAWEWEWRQSDNDVDCRMNYNKPPTSRILHVLNILCNSVFVPLRPIYDVYFGTHDEGARHEGNLRNLRISFSNQTKTLCRKHLDLQLCVFVSTRGENKNFFYKVFLVNRTRSSFPFTKAMWWFVFIYLNDFYSDESTYGTNQSGRINYFPRI